MCVDEISGGDFVDILGWRCEEYRFWVILRIEIMRRCYGFLDLFCILGVYMMIDIFEGFYIFMNGNMFIFFFSFGGFGWDSFGIKVF